MVKAVNIADNKTDFRLKQSKDKADGETRLLPDNTITRINQTIQKTESAFTYYPVKGLKGDVNSNFYEFLTMGIVPYLIGSGMFMFVFNAVNKHLDLFSKEKASAIGKKMGLGVVLYGLFKNLSKDLVTKPVKVATGVSVDMPYQNKVYNLPKGAGADAEIETTIQQRKVYDSIEFYRKDLLDKSYFDKIAKKVGLGENLNDSVTETSPIIQNIVSTTNTAKSLSSYCWAAVGVGLAMQDSWQDFFSTVSKRSKYISPKNASLAEKLSGHANNFCVNFLNGSKSLLNAFGKSWTQMWRGRAGETGYMKHCGKGLISVAALATVSLTANTIIKAKIMAKRKNTETIDKTKESTVI